MAAPQIVIGPPTSGEYIGLYAAVERYGLAYSSLRAWVRSGRLPAYRTPNGRVWLRPED